MSGKKAKQKRREQGRRDRQQDQRREAAAQEEQRFYRAFAGVLINDPSILHPDILDMAHWGVDPRDPDAWATRVSTIFTLGPDSLPYSHDEATEFLSNQGYPDRDLRASVEEWVDDWFREHTAEIVYTDEYIAFCEERFAASPLAQAFNQAGALMRQIARHP